MHFRSDFLWGIASAGHQVEGNNINSDIWAMEQVPDTPIAEPSGDACDSYHRYEEDIDLVACAGLNSYRFSTEWSRIEPEPGKFSRAELDHYRRMVDACHQRGIEPVLTLNHFTVPAWFARDGAWSQDAAPALFERFTQRVVEHLGDAVTWWGTFNEPNAGALLLSSGELPFGDVDQHSEFGRRQAARAEAFARRVGGSPDVATMALPILAPHAIENVFEAHRRSRAVIKELLPNAMVGWSIAVHDFQAAPGGEGRVAEIMATAIEPFWDAAKDDDYIGIQTYTRQVFGPDGRVEPEDASPHETLTGWEYYPAAVAHTAVQAAAHTGRPVLITENGIATSDDSLRVSYTEEALSALHEAVADGLDLRGYIHWMLLDTWAFGGGYRIRFGMVDVDRQTFARTPKPSLARFGEFARSAN
ncbi:glycoside hydrolase family 1 protein [Microbacterium sp. NPDC056044]|uniref:glycoside hydrolase family 1 protein n=1 Tax=Microbacterium sp. NPDC056044 TaxID=3345690 RepID=UPI0035DA3700